MKKHLITLLLTFCCTLSFAQSQSKEPEKVKPMMDTEIVRNISIIDIEGIIYENVQATIKSISADYFVHDKARVKVTIKNEKGENIWKKTLKNAYMYVFSNGQIQVGKPNFDQLIISKSTTTNNYIGMIREKEGIY